ncbi:phosphatidylinositol phosphatase PTPRQ isoform D [Alligator mississippiensis]|uniref:Phosphatidylinositol phosphatase PTPRQ n=1 Tax=Alligator mississippiensis TaxID=8496 RepID=A0A151PFG2_ALLMI|nr:phosphatidylinositol phosphatase PTPRQ isoform D [Alligator mississippiensis]
MIPWSIFLVHSLLFSLQGSYCKFSLLKRTLRNEFNATRQKRDLLAAETETVSPQSRLHGPFIQSPSPSGGTCPQECLNGATCTEAGACDCQTFQAQGKRCQIVPNAGKERNGICKSWGQYNFETFDGIYYYFPGNCSYIFAKDCSAPEPQYTVWVHNSPQCDGSVYSCLRSISLFFSNQEEIVILGHEVRKEGIRLTLPQTIGNVFFERLADYILVKTTFGFSLAWDGSSVGHYTEDIAVFANSWSVQTLEDATCVPTASDFSSPCSTDTEFSEAIFFKCQVLLQFPFLSCHESIDPYSYISSCMNDLCRTDDDETYCRAVTEYARACSHAGYPVRDWRDDFPACTEKCEDSFVHRDCISCCPPTCTFEKDCLGSNLHCLDGCYCPDGLIMENETCISVSNCPCIYHGVAFPVGSKIQQECSNCICIGGIWNCTEHDCPAECSVVGNSHFTTFDGRYFTFLGICQYVLVKGTGKDKFTVILRNAPCGQKLDHACIQSIMLILEDDMNKQVTITRNGDVQIGPNQGLNINGDIEIRNLSSLFVQLKTRFGLKILFAKDGERLYIQVDISWKRRTLGLCGTFNGNLRDDFLSPAGMVEGTPQLHASAWKVSSSCFVPVNIPVVDPCNINQQNVGYASLCDIVNQELFAPCHAYVNPGLYYQLCRFDACKCGSSCLCNALAHYAYICGKHGITVDFRTHISFCAVVCHSGMVYHHCSSTCEHSCASLSALNVCGPECAEGCNCPDGKYFEESVKFCVPLSSCRCYYKGRTFQSGEILPVPSGSCQCLNGTMKCAETATSSAVRVCPEGKTYYDCRYQVPGLPAAGVNCETSCANLAMNFSCVPPPPCASGCICPPGMAEHKGKCYVPDSCPCTWKDREYLSGEVIATPCYTCICRRGIFSCTSYPCPAVCTVYGDRHYYTFDGLEYDYVSDCQAYLVKSTDNSNISIIAENRKCFDNDIVCSKSIFISVGDMEIYFSETSDKQKKSKGQENRSTYQLWKAGYYTVIHFPEQEITILWDKKTTIHVKVGPRWKGKLAGLCGNFDKYTSNDLTTSNNMEVRNAQVFGESWTIGQCKTPNETIKPCEVHQSKFPYAKKECSVLYSDVFAPCRNVIDVTSFVKNCHTDTCNCNLGGDCECLCTSIAAYSHKCCEQGVVIHWRSPSLCPYDCEYYNQGVGEGPYILVSYGQNDTIIGANLTSRKIFPLPKISTYGKVFINFMITPGLFKDKDLSPSLISLESAERPNYFLCVHDNETIYLEQWQASSSFRRRATFFHHQGLWIPGYSAFELHSKKGFFIILTASGVKVSKYNDSEEFKRSSSFSIEELHASVPYRRMCEWRYEPCASPCVSTCSDPEGVTCKFLPPVEGCLPYCPKNMILDEVTLKCVYPEDCIPVMPTESAAGTKAQRTKPLSSTEPGKTQTSVTDTKMMTVTADYPSFGTMVHTLMPSSSSSSECMPRYIEPIDRCSQYVCVNMGWMLYNLSRNCPKNVEKPDCGFRGMPVQVNSDSCCPEWECPCQCSVLSELSIITFDGNNIALYNAASYILVKLPGEIIVAHVEKCPTNQSANSIRKLVPPGGTSGLCFKKLNVTTLTYKVLIDRLARKVVVDSVIQPLPFSKHGFCIQDTGAMYVINTPAGISIKWAHITGIIDIQYGLHSNTSTKTEGLCGMCNGDPFDDLKMQNRTIITHIEEIEAFIRSWEIEKSVDVMIRRPVRNCTEDNCTYCMELLNRKVFIPCHKKVSPQDFCGKMWINNTYFWNYECDALSAYVALCNKHNICIKWRTPDYCSLNCPDGKEYQPCVQPCEAKTCLNKWFHEESPCSYLREDCVCKNGTILHRTDSDLCIPEEKCTCTDNEGQPRSAGEFWKGSIKTCCMYSCLENGSVIAVEPECSEDSPPICEREGEVTINVIQEGACCPKQVCECNMTLCEALIPICKTSEKLVIGYNPLSCCPQYRCECDPSACPNASHPDCREDQFVVEAKQEDPCCFLYLCGKMPYCVIVLVVCESCVEPVPLCNEGEILTVDQSTTHYCCPHYHCVCDENLCSMPLLNCTDDMKLVKENIPGQCCPEWHCECSCENITKPTCKLGELPNIDSNIYTTCGCMHYTCEKEDVCVFQEVTLLNPGQFMIQYLDGDLCYTVQCLQEKDHNTGYHAMDFTVVNCSQQCETHQIYIPSSSHHTCCGTCRNVSCPFYSANGTLAIYEEGSTWNSNCTKYECAKTDTGAVILGSSVACPPFNETECTKNGGTVQIYNDGCCKTCKKEERICQKVTVRTTIRKNDCISQTPINVASCDGKCPSATIFNVNIDSHLRFCKGLVFWRSLRFRNETGAVSLKDSYHMDQAILLLCLLESVFQISKSLDCDQVRRPTRPVLLEWSEFPKGENPELYVVTYQQTDDFHKKNVENISTVVSKPLNSILLEENKSYDVTIEALKNGKILSGKSFKTRGISVNNIKTFVAMTTVSFNWSILANDFSVSISLNNMSRIMQQNDVFSEWDNLTSATLYSFKFEFKQLLLEFISVSQTLDIQVETGLCSQGWLAFKGSCYKISRESKPWGMAQQICELSALGAHLVDIKTEEENAFISSYLQRFNKIIILWTGLNDMKEEGHLVWTDGSPYLGKNDISSLSVIPENETDCYAFQQNPTGPNYFFTGFFCFLSLPYICEYELPPVPDNFMFYVQDIQTTEAVFGWSDLRNWLKSGFELIIKYYLDHLEQHIQSLSRYTTHARVDQLSPGRFYRFLLSASSPSGAYTNLSPILLVETRPLHSQNLEAVHVSSTEIHLQWDPPQNSTSASFHYYLVTILDAETNKWEKLAVEKINTSTIIGNLKPFHQYYIYLQTVAEKGSLSCNEKTILITTAVSPPSRVFIHPEDVQEDSMILNWELPPEGQKSYIQVKPIMDVDETVTFQLNNTQSLKVDLLIPGMTYEIAVATVNNGNMSELKIIQCTLKPKPVEIVVPYEVHSYSVILFIKMPDVGIFDGIYVTSKGGPNATFALKNDDTITIENLIPGTEYDFYVFTISGNMLSSVNHVSAVRTCLAAPTNVREGNITDTSIQIVWDRADGNFQQYEVTCTNCARALMVQKITQEMAVFSSLIPGMLYNFTVRTEKEGFKDSLFEIKGIETEPNSVKYVNHSKDSESITVTWPPAQNIFDGYIVSIVSKSFSKKEILSSSVRIFKFDGLLPGTDYLFNIVTTNGLKRSRPTMLKISTNPDPPSDLQVLGKEEHTIYFSWKVPRGGFDAFQLSYHLRSSETLFTTTVNGNRAVVKNLIPGMEYLFQLKTINGLDSSTAIEKKVNTKPAAICGLTLRMANTSSAALMWNPTRTNFTYYKAFLSNTTFIKEYNISRALSEFTVTSLTAGGIYNFTIQRIRGSVQGVSMHIEIVTEPAKPEGLRASNISSYFFSLHWRLPYGHVDRFQVDLTPEHGFVTILELGGGQYQADFSSTTPGTTYNVTVSSVSSSAYSSPVSRTVTTNVTNPGPPVFLAGERVGSAGILLSWNTPPHPNGRIISYIVKYKEVCPWMQTTYTEVTAKPDSLEVLLTNLNPGTTYEIKVAAENSAGVGVFSDPFLFQTAESAPGKVVNLTVEALNYSAVNLIWFLPRQPNGKITSFKISVKHARSGIVVKDVSVKVEDLLSGRLPECNDNSESFLWSTTTPSTTFGKSTVPSQTTLTPVTIAPSKMSSVWNEPISFVVTNLRPYTTYLFEVSAVTTEAGYIDSAIVRTPESVPEDAPQNFAKGNITAKSFSVSWDPPTIVTGKFSYRVELYGPSGRIVDNSTKDLKFIFNNLIPFTTYDVYVGAETSAGVGPKANLTIFTPAGVPSAVSDLQLVEVEATLIKIVWRKPQQPNGIITQYRVTVIVQNTGEPLENTILTGKIKYLIDSMDPDIINENIQSFTWNTIETATGLYEGSGEMFSTIQTDSPGIFMSLSNDNLPNMDGAEELHSASDNEYAIDISAEELSYVIKGLLPFTNYTISVSAFTMIGEGPPAVLSVRTCEQVPSSVQNIHYKNISSSSVLLYWDPPANPNGKITHYTVYAMELDTKRTFQLITTNNSLFITGLEKYTNYKMRVAASTTVGESALSEENDIFVRTPEDEPGSPPQNVKLLDATATEINLRWSPPDQPNGIITHYEVLYNYANDLFIKNTSNTSILLRGLKPYTAYNISVRAFTRLGHGNQSSFPLSVRTPETVPDTAPENITYRNISSMEIELSFFPPSDPNGIIQKYTVYLRESNGTEQRIINSTLQTLRITGLKKYTKYTVEISASTTKGEGVHSAPHDILTDEDVPSSPPESLSVKQLSGVIVKLSWKPPLEPNGIILYYTVHVWDKMSKRSVNVTETSLQFTDLENNNEYSAYVTASTRFGDGNIKSSTIKFRTSEGAPSDPPKDVTYVNLTSSSILIFWSPPQKPNGIIQYYSIYYKNNSGIFMQNFTHYNVDSGADNKSLSAVLDNLAKFSYYTLWLTASTAFGNGNKTSDVIEVYTDQDIPDGPVESLTYQNISSTAINVSWLPPSQPNGIVLFYVSLSLWNIQNHSEILSLITYNTSMVFDKLEKYTDYLLQITPATEKGLSEIHTAGLHIKTDEDVPESAPIITTFKNLSSTSVLLSWDPPLHPSGIIISYDLNLLEPGKSNYFFTSNNSIILEDLLPFTLYSFFAAARTIKGLGPYATLLFYTDESVPLAPPQNLTIVNYTADSVWLKWNPSPQPNGVIKRYTFKIHQGNNENLFFQNVSGSQNEANLVGLEPFSTYFISISAFTKVGNGNQFSNIIKFTTKESVPDIVQNVQCTATSWQSVLVQWDPPSKSNGIITHYIISSEGNSTNFSFYDMVHTVRHLMSNVSYQFKIRAATSAGEGEEQICNASTFPERVPSAPRDIAFSNVQSTSVTLRWITPDSILGYFQNYKITIQLQSMHCEDWEINGCVEYEKVQYSHGNVVGDHIEETVHELKKFRWYRFKVAASTNAGYGSSSPWISTQMLPGSPDGPPENVTVVAVSPHSINISWNEPDIITGPTSYLINITSVDSDNYKAVFLKTNDEDRTLEISDLKAFTKYSVVIIAFTGDVNAAYLEGKASTPVIVSTFETVPKDPPNNITFQKIPNEVTKFQVTFVPPSEPNGNIQIYQAMVYNEEDPSVVQIHNLSVIDKTNKLITAMIEGLKGGYTYNISVYAINSAGAGPKIQLKITMDIKEPPRPKKKPTPVYNKSGALLVTDTTIAIKMPVCYYSDVHGPIKKIQVLVAEAGVQHDGNVTKWYDAYFKKPRPYFTNEGFPNPPCLEGKEGVSVKEDVYVIGADTTCLIPGSEDKICNGPLKPRKQYLFKFRATNVKGQFTDSEYSDPIKTLGEGVAEGSTEAGLAVTLCILSMILLVAAVYAFAKIRKKQKEGGTYSPRDAEIIDTKFKLDQLITVADLELKDERFTRPISKKSFLQHVEELCTNNNLKFQEEFSELPKFLEDLASTDADLPWNRSKNRFPNIKPYNNNRVKLMADAGIPGSDYINASYVSGYLCPNEFIATQGPLPGTVGDFWRMVWETRAKTLVMLTQCFEKGRIRCHQYWPEDNKPVTVFGDIVITKLMEDNQRDWTIREIKIERHGDFMMVRQCNFTSWPEHGVPETTAPLIHFVKLIRASRAHDNTPMVIHCSAGVGRTGVFIALDHLTQHINDHDFVDIYGLVAELRSERMCMVQNLAQYIFLHQCVLDLLTSTGSSQPICFVNYSALQKMDSLDAMEGDVELEWEETTIARISSYDPEQLKRHPLTL